MKKLLIVCVLLIGLYEIAYPSAPAAAQPRPYCDDNPTCDTPDPTWEGLANPARGHLVLGTVEDPLSMFTRRPIDVYTVPAGGGFLDPGYSNGYHYGIDYAFPGDYTGPLWVYPVASGYVTTRATCYACYVDGDSLGRVNYASAPYNFGFGSFILIETPYSEDLSLYTLYAHFSRDFVGLGDYIAPGEILGMAGSVGYSQRVHVHLEIRYGAPGLFWNADFSQPDTRDRWLATMLLDPSSLMFPENHAYVIGVMHDWLATQPHDVDIP